MSAKDDAGHEYGDTFVAGLEWMWGEGFLSPGGPEEVAALLHGVDLAGRTVLDIGCGLGGADILLAREHGAARVVGIDVEAPLTERARATAERAGLADRIEIRLVEPGPLPFDDDTFDVVFSKDSIIHIPDKQALYTEVLRVLHPAGLFAGSDWLRGGESPHAEPMQAWLDIVGLTFEMQNLEQTRAALEAAGFERVEMRDRNAWYHDYMREELATMEGDRYAALVERIGEEAAAQRLASSTAKKLVVDRGELRPTHFRGRRPG